MIYSLKYLFICVLIKAFDLMQKIERSLLMILSRELKR
nr:MAG TPA: hypothetical protein [Bacteriophage sp.]